MKVRAVVPADVKKNIPAWLRWRITSPFETIERLTGNDMQLISTSVEDDTDIVVLPRLVDVDMQWIKDMKDAGIKVIYEVDDDIFSESYISQQARQYWSPEMGDEGIVTVLDIFEEKVNKSKEILQVCSAVTTTTYTLGRYIQTLTDVPIYIVPNAIDAASFTKGLMSSLDKPNKLTIGWAGGIRPYSDLEAMHQAWKRIVRHSIADITFVVAGWRCPEIVDDPDLQQYIEYRDWIDWDIYGQNMQVDIGCCAVDGSEFSSRKSAIKAWEFTLAGATVIGAENLYCNEPMLLSRNDEEGWFHAIMYYMSNPTARLDMKELMQSHVMGNHNLESEYYKWIDAYERIMKWT